jgi:cytochrome P450
MAQQFDAAAYLTGAYQGEVFGEAYFALLAERASDADEAAKWRVLEHLERHVKGRLRVELERRGLPSQEIPTSVEAGRTAAQGTGAFPSGEDARRFRDSLQSFVDKFRADRDAAPDDLKELAEFVLGHEEALFEFAEAAVAGEPSVRAAEAFLEKTGAEKDVPLPEGVQLTPLDDAFREDPNPTFHLLQQRAPVHRDRAFGRFVLTRHDEVLRVMRDLEFWVDVRKSTDDDYFRRAAIERIEASEREQSMLGLDDPEHKRLRNLVSGAFTPRAVDKWQPIVEQVARDLVEAVEGQDEFDLVEALANPLPAIAIAKLLGVDESKQADFKVWSEVSVTAGFNPFASDEEKAAADQAQKSLDAVFVAEIAKRRESPSDDLIGKMVTANEEGDQLTEAEIATMCGLLLVAGNVTTSDLIGNGVKALCEHPEQLAKLQANPDLLPNAIEEMLRFDPPVTQSGRIAPYDFEIGGVPIKQGQSFTTVLAAANRDPDIYPDPDKFDVEREDTHHQSFGGGAHLCLGAHLARLEAREAIGALVRRFPKLRAADKPCTWKRVPGFRGLSEYWLRVD